MGLPDRGIVAAVQLALYVPMVLLTLLLVFRHGFRRTSGWIFLAIFSIVRVAGAILIIILEKTANPSTGLFTAASIVVSIGLTPLFFATMGFLSTVAQRSDSPGMQAIGQHSKIFRILHLVIIVGMALVISATVGITSENSNSRKNSSSQRKAGGVLFLIVYIALVLIHGYCWVHRDEIRVHRRRLLIGISCALPFFLVRVLYTFLGALQTSPLSNFNPIFGSLALYTAMSVVMEFIIVLIYTTVGMMTPLDLDEEYPVKNEPQEYDAVPNGPGGQQYARA
ncbi:hypothetical protein SISSUDRAFT_1034155 [Sistotremastrum suecicum HHB10207 ss-3]|uniref:DUF7702 domain-containing protein n=1 Tax=Sistotremastrum suecicum HHB10207 ss-3 TaxID=1314776 RepID=A0A166CDU3_9AGAM|nr:hypothetical protein SISSUDRAFT_1034155 [Sistotremastrum suecicum HHB10207 ss-3]